MGLSDDGGSTFLAMSKYAYKGYEQSMSIFWTGETADESLFELVLLNYGSDNAQ